jgi:hypothetical protein
MHVLFSANDIKERKTVKTVNPPPSTTYESPEEWFTGGRGEERGRERKRHERERERNSRQMTPLLCGNM